ncbi:MAG: hypothetical protein CR971_02235 [candidate division SR1 bacterium]|nr:MAG: hypothetical protein CR971_02235 [candidate division SR1 bacterium]
MSDMIDTTTLKYLQNLAKLQIHDEKQFSQKFSAIVHYLEKIKDVNISEDISKQGASPMHHLETLDTLTPAGTKKLLNNVEHEVVNNSIVVSSVLSS